MLAVEVYAFYHKSYQTSAHLICITFYVHLLVVGSRVLWFWNWHSGSNSSAQLNTVQSWYWRKANRLDCELRHHFLLISTFMFCINILFKLFCRDQKISLNVTALILKYQICSCEWLKPNNGSMSFLRQNSLVLTDWWMNSAGN